MDAFTDWDQVPLVCDIKDAARVFNVSVCTLRRRLETNAQVPGVLPRSGQEAWRFSKPVMRNYVDGGYVNLRVVRRRA